MGKLMNFYAVDPQSKLNNDIQGFWSLEESRRVYNSEAIIPDSSVEVVFNCGAPLKLALNNEAEIELPQVFIKGIQRKPLELRVDGDIAQSIGISLNVWAVPMLPDVEWGSDSEAIIRLGGVWHDLARTIADTVNRRGYAEAVGKLQEFVGNVYQGHEDLNTIRQVGRQLYDTQGQIPIRELASCHHISLSQLERRFKRLTGITLKHFARLIRFETARNQLHQASALSLADLAQALGYTDQAHFTNDFKSFADRTPRAYLNQLQHFPAQNADFLQE